MFHILDFAGSAGMTAKVTRCATFKNKHEEKEMQETTSITITSRSHNQSSQRLEKRFAFSSQHLGYSLSHSGQSRHSLKYCTAELWVSYFSICEIGWIDRDDKSTCARTRREMIEAPTSCRKHNQSVREGERRGDRQTDRNDIMPWVLPPCSVRCGLQLQGSKCWLHSGRERSLMDHWS